eukprot:GFYU01001488.1.p1 GENE.GFYU01001488.1~~GFYU01001488.1.p1  ORF type:complete len:207 (+),score=66.66 GFYU01001488.1:98-718(+)
MSLHSSARASSRLLTLAQHLTPNTVAATHTRTATMSTEMTMSTFNCADLLDAFDNESLQIVDPRLSLKTFGSLRRFAGQVSTLKCFEDNSFVRKAVESDGQGKVLVIDGQGSMNRALVGDQLAALAIKNGWKGILVHGPIRDSEEINGMKISIKAMGTHPRKTLKKNVGDRDVEVSFGGVTIKPGDWIYSDDDGIIISPTPFDIKP